MSKIKFTPEQAAAARQRMAVLEARTEREESIAGAMLDAFDRHPEHRLSDHVVITFYDDDGNEVCMFIDDAFPFRRQ